MQFVLIYSVPKRMTAAVQSSTLFLSMQKSWASWQRTAAPSCAGPAAATRSATSRGLSSSVMPSEQSTNPKARSFERSRVTTLGSSIKPKSRSTACPRLRVSCTSHCPTSSSRGARYPSCVKWTLSGKSRSMRSCSDGSLAVWAADTRRPSGSPYSLWTHSTAPASPNEPTTACPFWSTTATAAVQPKSMGAGGIPPSTYSYALPKDPPTSTSLKFKGSVPGFPGYAYSSGGVLCSAKTPSFNREKSSVIAASGCGSAPSGPCTNPARAFGSSHNFCSVRTPAAAARSPSRPWPSNAAATYSGDVGDPATPLQQES
eukprot:m.455005 g.455005  ORF g.455005 m.455005 type:complete len:316 (+) comp20792_c0_seq1:3173-4120(+)